MFAHRMARSDILLAIEGHTINQSKFAAELLGWPTENGFAAWAQYDAERATWRVRTQLLQL